MIDLSSLKAITEKYLTKFISDEIFRDNDPENSAWWSAVYRARRYRRGKARKFFTLWLDEIRRGRRLLGCDGLADATMQSTTYSGGAEIVTPLVLK